MARRKRETEEASGPIPAPEPQTTDFAQAVDESPAPEFDYSRGGQRFANFEEWRRFCVSYPNRRATVTYIYRLWPVIDRRQIGRSDSALEKVNESTDNAPPGGVPDIEYLGRVWGSGSYMLMFNDLNKPKYNQIARCTVELNDPMAEPNIDPRELVLSGNAAEKNQSIIANYLRMGWTILETRNDLINGSFQRLNPPNAVGQAPVAAPSPQPAPGVPAGHVVVDAATFQRLMASHQASAPAGGLSGMGPIQTVFDLAERVNQMRNPAPAPAAQDPIAELERYARLMRAFGWQAPGTAAASAASAAAASDSGAGASSWFNLLAKAPEILREIRMLAQTVLMPGMVAAAPAGFAAPMPQELISAEGEEGEEDEEEESMLIPDLGTLMAVGNMAKSAFEQGMSGEQLALALYEDAAKRPVFNWLRSLGQEAVLSYLKSAPGMNALVSPNPEKFDGFIGQFFAWGNSSPSELLQ